VISTGINCGIQILVEYKEVPGGNLRDRKSAKIDWRELRTEEQKVLFDKLKEFRQTLAKEQNLKANYLVCKDEHIAAIINKPDITEDEIRNLPNSGTILIKQFSRPLLNEYQRLLKERSSDSSLPLQNPEHSMGFEDEQSRGPF
jgi:HRDC domain.